MKVTVIGLFVVDVASICWYQLSTMALTPVIVVISVWLGFSTINGCLAMGKNPKTYFQVSIIIQAQLDHHL
jgi:hypothetical protein